MVSHWFGTCQWQLPNEADYRKLQALFACVAEEKHQRGELATPHQQLVSTYSELNRQYASLLEEYKSLRRYFLYRPPFLIRTSGRISPCSIIRVSIPAKTGGYVASDNFCQQSSGGCGCGFFMGSGATIKAAMGLGRRTIGVELESGRFEQTVGEILVLNDKLRNAQLDKNRS